MPIDQSFFKDLIRRKVLLLDGSMGVMIQRMKLTEEQFRGERFKNHPIALKGNNDILCLTAPEVISSIHRQYLEAGADIIETNTFNSTALSQHEYGTERLVRELNIAGARIARAEADRYSTDGHMRFVAGSIGPTGVAASMSADINDPASRSVSFDELSRAFEEQAGALIEGGVDILLAETIFDALNAKAAINGIRRAMTAYDVDLPLILSITVSDSSGRILSGHTPEAFLSIVRHARPFAVGFNCSAGPASLEPFIRRMASASPYATIFYPNAGLPDSMGNYNEDPARFATAVAPLLHDGCLNIVGGCCGTTPTHIAELSRIIANDSHPRKCYAKTQESWLAGLEEFSDSRGFINIGERCNVAGSRKFLRLIKEKAYDEALAIARKQVADGAMILDINMDDGLLDTKTEMQHFLRLMSTDPDVATVPWMIDSSDFDVIEMALKEIPGRAIVNSISLKHGESEFLEQAEAIHRYGAAVVIMAFDENGQATTFERKTEICHRAYNLLTKRLGFDPRDIIFDPNVLTIATGMPEHDRYALDFIKAVGWIHDNLPGAKTSGGLSNLSFAFRGNNYLRQSMHAVFLYHAISAGLSMAIMDPAAKVTYDSIPDELLVLLEDAILCRRSDAADRLIDKASMFSGDVTVAQPEKNDKPADVDGRLQQALIRGDDTCLQEDISEALGLHGSAHAVVEGPLMKGMERVGQLFECGKMFLPQVVKSARTMHRAVDILRPMLEAGRTNAGCKGVFLLATVKGDVHDIGKNIAAVVLNCNNFEVIDLGVQVEAHTIVEAALKYKPQFIGLSGLISPSLNEMVVVANALSQAGVDVPLFVGGAATSELHAAIHIAPAYQHGVVVRVSDASQDPVIASRLLSDYDNESCSILKRQQQLRDDYSGSATSDSAGERISIDWNKERLIKPSFYGARTLENISITALRPLINWIYFNNCWKVTPGSEVAEDLRKEADVLLDKLEKSGAAMRCRVAFYGACSDNDNILIESVTIETPRQLPSQSTGRQECLALADFIAPKGYGDHIGCFVVTIDDLMRKELEAAKQSDNYAYLLLQSVCDRLAEAASEWLHYMVRTELWGYAPDESKNLDDILHGKYQGIRPAVGYPSLPDQKLMHRLAELINPEEIGVTVTENGALWPASSVAGFYISCSKARYFSV